MMERWSRVKVFGDDIVLFDEFKDDKDALLVVELLLSDNFDTSSAPDHVVRAINIYKSFVQRGIIESLILSEDCDIEEIASLTGVDKSIIDFYEKIFFRIRYICNTKIEIIDFVESGIGFYSEVRDINMLNLFLLFRWTLSLGKDFVIWKYNLLPTKYNPVDIHSTIVKEAFFFHKERSMGNNDIKISEYLRSANLLLGSIKNGLEIKDKSEDNAALDIFEQLGIIVEEKEPPSTTIDELASNNIEIIDNATTGRIDE